MTEQELEQEELDWIAVHNGDPASLLLLAIKRRKEQLARDKATQEEKE
jgi:hypothetical protein